MRQSFVGLGRTTAAGQQTAGVARHAWCGLTEIETRRQYPVADTARVQSVNVDFGKQATGEVAVAADSKTLQQVYYPPTAAAQTVTAGRWLLVENLATGTKPLNDCMYKAPAAGGPQAVTDGRWLLVEDINLAPADVLAALVPLLERRRLHLPQAGRTVAAAPGFQMLATVTSAPGARLRPLLCSLGLVGLRACARSMGAVGPWWLAPAPAPVLTVGPSCFAPAAAPVLPVEPS